MVLSASQAMFTVDESDEADIREKAAAQLMYKTGQANLIAVCEELNSEAEESGSTYRFAYIPPHSNLTRIYPDPKMENGYMLIAYDISKVDFIPTVTSLQTERAVARQKVEEQRVTIYTSPTSPTLFKQAPIMPITTPVASEDNILKS